MARHMWGESVPNPPCLPQRVAARVIDLSRALQLKCRVTGDIADLEKTLPLCQEAIKLINPPHIFNHQRLHYHDMMSKMLKVKGTVTEEARDIERALSYCEELNNHIQQEDTPIDQDIRAIYFRNLSRALMLKYEIVSENIFNLELAITMIQQALNSISDSVPKAQQH